MTTIFPGWCTSNTSSVEMTLITTCDIQFQLLKIHLNKNSLWDSEPTVGSTKIEPKISIEASGEDISESSPKVVNYHLLNYH